MFIPQQSLFIFVNERKASSRAWDQDNFLFATDTLQL